jgi:sulfite reductase (ferredoxin)
MTLKFYDNPDILIEEQDQFETDIKSFVDGNIHPVKFKGIRVAHGVYEQRELETYMLRIRCAAGGLTPKQLRKVAELADEHCNNEVHFTTRQEIQIHELRIENIMASIRGLNEVGLSSRGGGGNTIRNILTSPTSGIDPDGVFDVDPYAMALTTRLIAEPDSWNLPRKFKINFSHNDKDTAYTMATCLGFVATMKNDQKGFKVYCAGGMGAKPIVGNLLLDFIPDTQVYHVTRALKIMFDKHGNRRSKYSNRIKFLWKKLQRDEFIQLFEEEYNKIKEDDSLALVLPELKNDCVDPNIPVETAEGKLFEAWKKRYVRHQKQPGLIAVLLMLRLGDLKSSDAYKLCDFLEQFGENVMRCARGQNVYLRNIPEKYIGNLYHVLASLEDTLIDTPQMVGKMINCTGAQTCKLGICLPRGLSDEIRESLMKTDLNLDSIPDFKIHMSGCPNTCGMHHVADLGFFGKIGRNSGDMYPSYNVLAGAKVGQGETKYAERLGDIAARDIPSFIIEFLSVYIAEKEDYDDYHDFLEDKGKEVITSLCDKYKAVPSYDKDPSYYTDFGAKKRLSLEDMGSAECSAGMFDMINVDRKAIESAIKTLDQTADQTDSADEETLYQLIFHVSRMLLVTRGLDSKTETQAITLFAKHFIEAGLIDKKYLDVVTLAKLGVKDELKKHQDSILGLAADIQDLYKSMDDSLKFRPKGQDELAAKTEQGSTKIEKDYRGVACPMNFVKTKLVLETMGAGQQLEILLDDGEPINNVPNSVKLEGHKIIQQTQSSDGYWAVLIEKG